jgi:hypothetical protein
MPVKRRFVKRREELSPVAMKLLRDQQLTKDECTEAVFLEADPVDRGELFEAWELLRDDLLTEWIAKWPGTRPTIWWTWDAPRQAIGTFPGWFYDGKLPESRRRLGGIGTPKHEALAYFPEFTKGVPSGWVSDWDVAYYNGRARDVHGKPIGTEYAEGHFPYHAIDPDDPPVFESEAAYLKRHGLFRASEERRLKAADFAPVSVLDVIGFDPAD